MNPSEFEGRLNLIIPSDDAFHIDALAAFVEEAGDVRSHPQTASAIFEYMERYSTNDLGSPGPLVHFLEKAFPSYTPQLVASIRRRPVFYTLWMANRILNAKIDVNTRKLLTEALKVASSHPEASDRERQQAIEFLALHAQSMG
ncbi:hypothetical protein HPT27_15565 [Permianibacter sp. IMCC34836]|uniref:hypothetical protein n=1 Tax=Permianibacter fluminis TaxID=2738515 RepID=UPI001553201A|nr:hypothetical protein [Permianibacter fluminis]NQD38439.1 hypothetical protein [Permianibacter fluminis]